MKIVFRLNYHTVPGQSIWLNLTAVLEKPQTHIRQLLPMSWMNDRQWGAEIDIRGEGRVELSYFYQFRQEPHGLELDEWGGPRTAAADPDATDALILIDGWRSAGSIDCVWETQALRMGLAGGTDGTEPAVANTANHTFNLHLTAVPPGLVPCLIGSALEIGDWGWHRAVPLQQVSANLWSTRVHLPDDWHVEYKYGFFDPKLGCTTSLEDGPNRILDPRANACAQHTIVNDEAYRRDHAALFRAAGVAIPVFSLRGKSSLGVGEFADLKALADWAADIGLKLIQILPVNDTTSTHDWRDSYPYSAISATALHPVYLRIDDLGWPMPADFKQEIATAREALNAREHVDYEEVIRLKTRLTRRIFQKHREAITASPGFCDFLAENRDWLAPYASFCVKRDEHGSADFSQWGDAAAYDPQEVDAMAAPDSPRWPEIAYHIWLQYELDRQLSDAVAHLHQRGIALKGDLPIGIDRHSVEAWSAPERFKPDTQSGAPPDAFAVKGQNWDFPTYDWDFMRRDGFAWWRSRFEKLSRYFDAYRIDHILGFFRIWQIPRNQVEGIMGWFDPAIPIHIDEFAQRGIPFDYKRHCQPCIREDSLAERFGPHEQEARDHYLDDLGRGRFQLREHVRDQRRIVDHFAGRADDAALRQALLDCVSDVLFLEVPGSGGTQFHPRCAMQSTRSYRDLDHDIKWRVEELYIDYFHRRQEGLWQARGYEKLQVMRSASRMLLCGEDLGMVPACVPGVLRELGILSLEIQRMPKTAGAEFSDPSHAPYLSVVSPSTHDMSTLRGWWRESPELTARFSRQYLDTPAPAPDLDGETAAAIIRQHLQSPAMWAIFPLQDLLAIDEKLRHPDPDAERINIPAVMPHYWRYRMHLTLDELAAAKPLNAALRKLVLLSGRSHPPSTQTLP